MPEFPVTPPHEAGKQIRVLATQLYEVLRKPPQSQHLTFHSDVDVDTAWTRVSDAHYALEKAITTRRLTLMRPALAHYREMVRAWRNVVYLTATNQINAKTVNYPLTSMGIPVAAAMEQLRNLANNLPSQPDMPSADSRDTALRAIIAVLRTHEVPGAEKLTHNAKEDPSVEAQKLADQAASGQIAPGSAAPKF